MTDTKPAAGKALPLLHFRTGSRNYALDLMSVKEIIRIVAIDHLPELPPFVRGVINLRGEIVPIIDFHHRAGAGQSGISIKSRIIILKIKALTAGLLVDDVLESSDIDASEVSSNIQSDLVIDRKYISGTFISKHGMVILVDIEKLLTDKEFHSVEKVVPHA